MLFSTASLGRIDVATWAAIACMALGWFGLNSLVATFGPIRHAAHFYELPIAISDPLWLLRGLAGSHTFGTVVFVAVCLMFIAAPALARSDTPWAPWGSCAPLALMLLTGIVFYVKASSTHIEAGADMGRLGGWIAHVANGAISWTGDVVARHVAIGAGGYLSFLASGYLAWRGIRDRRTARREGRFAAR